MLISCGIFLVLARENPHSIDFSGNGGSRRNWAHVELGMTALTPGTPARNMVSISTHFIAENLQRKRTISLSSCSIAVSIPLFKRTQPSVQYGPRSDALASASVVECKDVIARSHAVPTDVAALPSASNLIPTDKVHSKLFLPDSPGFSGKISTY